MGCQQERTAKCHPWLGWRHGVRCIARDQSANLLCSHIVFPGRASDQALLPTNLGNIHWCCHIVWLLLFPIRLACAREGYSSRHYPIQSYRPSRQAPPRSIPTFSRSRLCVTLPAPFHTGGVPYQDHLHYCLAGGVPLGVWSPCPCFQQA